MAKSNLAKALIIARKSKNRGRHSPAGYVHLQGKKKGAKKTKPTYFKGKAFQRPTIEQRLMDAGISPAKIKKLKGKK